MTENYRGIGGTDGEKMELHISELLGGKKARYSDGQDLWVLREK